ncbi:MAG TPA: phosphotransferase [Planctomycetaceae bacterium]|nr:phosphotransferase [Planctomycetaceae bacterium]
MFPLDPQNALAWLHSTGWLPEGEPAEIVPLAWGVSNVVLRVEPATTPHFVLKQSREQLRTRDPWFSRLDRIWREADAMRVLQPLLPPGRIPQVLKEDRPNYVFSMEAAPARHTVWKQALLEGDFRHDVALQLGRDLAQIHTQTAANPALCLPFADRQVFVELRVDPFYKRVLQAAPEVGRPLEQMIDQMFETQICLVHGDFSPKNVLLTQEGVVLVDFETVHWGDPAFDLGFFLSHLLLKTVLHRDRFEAVAGLSQQFWRGYLARLDECQAHPILSPDTIVSRTLPHLAGCMWARIDGTSKIDYLPQPQQQVGVRDFCRGLLLRPPGDWGEVLNRLKVGKFG